MLSNARNVFKCLINRSMVSQIRSLSTTGYSNIIVDVRGDRKNVGHIQINRPKALNALCDAVIFEMTKAIHDFDVDKDIAAIVLSGSEKAFAAGADIKEMSKLNSFDEAFKSDFPSKWHQISSTKPLIAAVNGYALGGGSEMVLMCDIVYAGENAKFGQPEIGVGIIPGAGATQKLTKDIGKSRTMEMVLTGKYITAKEAESWGIVSKVFPSDKVLEEAIKLGERIGNNSKLITAICKESVKNAYETTLSQGLNTERRLNHSTFATSDRLEGMKAFVEKRVPKFTDK